MVCPISQIITSGAQKNIIIIFPMPQKQAKKEGNGLPNHHHITSTTNVILSLMRPQKKSAFFLFFLFCLVAALSPFTFVAFFFFFSNLIVMWRAQWFGEYYVQGDNNHD
jgi:hypothetical protein